MKYKKKLKSDIKIEVKPQQPQLYHNIVIRYGVSIEIPTGLKQEERECLIRLIKVLF